MPTIQFRTDDQTKAASTALFNRLGITMSEAINLFLRQSIMRGGIPFPLQVPREYTEEIWNGAAFIDALRRYKIVNHKADFDIAKAEPFLRAIAGLGLLAEPHLTFYEDAIKARLNFNGKEFAIDYNFEEPENAFILSKLDGKLMAKDCGLADIKKTLEFF